MNPDKTLAPVILVLFGITGDLARRKILPALYHLFKDNLMPEHIEIIGTSRRKLSVDELLSDIEVCVLEKDNVCDKDALHRFRHQLRLLQLDPTADKDYEKLKDEIQSIEDQHGVCMNRLFYLSIPPQVYNPIVRKLGEHGLQQGCEHGKGQARLLVEKPFGYDLLSAQELIQATGQIFTEDQTYRIDHYLAKETAQNILAFRRHNPLFNTIWNNRHIISIKINAYENIGIEGRANFYDSVGALRDLTQSHLLQLLALTTMSLPHDINNPKEVHRQKQGLLEALTPYSPADGVLSALRAQYDSYSLEASNADSQTETFAAVRLWIKQPDWQGVPVDLVTGKALAEKRTEIIVKFADPDSEDVNNLSFRIQPDEGISLTVAVKKPGFAEKIKIAELNFAYPDSFEDHSHPDAYERVLLDSIKADQTLFATGEEVLASWRALQPVLDAWQRPQAALKKYPKGTAAEDILGNDN